MPFAIDRVVPWGRTLAEYRGMFALTDADLRRRLVGCGDGPASFNAELTAQHGRVVSIDPLYAAPARAIERRVEETFEVVIGEVRRNRDDFVWTHVPSIEELGRRRLAAMRRFLSDYGAGAQAGRYVAASLPALPFGDGFFDLALSSHFLFLYSEQLDIAFHLDSLREMLRVAGEVGVFPLLQIGGAPSPHVAAAAAALRSDGIDASVEPVPTSFSAVATGCCAWAGDSEALAPFFAEPATQSSARRLRGGT